MAAAVRARHEAIRGTGPGGEFTAPCLVLSSHAGIALSSPERAHLQSGEHDEDKLEFAASLYCKARMFSERLGCSWELIIAQACEP